MLNSAIRLLRGGTAVISKESSAVYWMRLRDIVFYAVVANRTILGMEQHLQVPLPFIRHIDVPFAVSGNPTKDYSPTPRSRRHEQPLPPIMKNERNKPNNPTETQATTARTQIAAQNSELGMSDSTGYRNPKSLSTAAAKMPRRSGYPKGSGEVLERDRGSKIPCLFPTAPARNK